jgi:hypothetical protein
VTRHYPANVFWSDEDEGFIALAPDLPGCSAFGDNRPKHCLNSKTPSPHGFKPPLSMAGRFRSPLHNITLPERLAEVAY